jgi:crotonobetainyl-CoA:carnitine CoA-transferase CaiB-like acyl-CoA transferase
MLARLDRARIATARLNTVAEFAAHPQLTARSRWREIPSPAGPLQVLAPPATIDGADPRMDGVPALGAHTQAVLGELGYDADAIRRLRVSGAI